MNKKKAKRVFLFSVFVLIMLIGANWAVKPYNQHIDEFLNSSSEADVLILGSSHSYCNLNAATLWQENNIKALCVGQSEQPVIMSYYTLKMALKHQKPKVVIFESYMSSVDRRELQQEEMDYINAFYGFPVVKNIKERVEVARLTLPEEKRNDYIWGFPTYHTQYVNLKKKLEYNAPTGGFVYMYGQHDNPSWNENMYSCKDVMVKRDIPEENIKYIYKIIELCKSEDIELLFLVTPYQAAKETMEMLLTVEEIAIEEKIPFVDMNSYIDEIAIEMFDDMYDAGHANIVGNEKNTLWLGRYLESNYQFESSGDSYTWDEIVKCKKVG